jgi:thiosulfate/3-mercaptopyruvate sulfurtransferase
VDVAAWKDLSTSEGGLHDVTSWSQQVGELGITSDLKVVVYGDRVTDAARIWWLLKYVGVKHVMILDGGWQLWTDADGAQEEDVHQVAQVEFKPSFQENRLEEIDSLKDLVRIGTAQIIDTRSKEEFTGEVVRGDRGGHIQDATHLDWADLVADDGRFKSKDELLKLFVEQGISPNQSAVCY